jgi:uncharacterized protein YaaQ
MKLIIAIVHDRDSEAVSQALISNTFRVTRIASSGGFFRRGSTTLMVGVEDESVDQAIEVIRQNTTPSTEKGTRRASMFVLNVNTFEQV